MDKVKECLNTWSTAICEPHYATYDLAKTVCSVPPKLLSDMLAGYWTREYGSTQSASEASTFFTIAGNRQMADKATDVALLPLVCSKDNVTCFLSEMVVKSELSRCNHGAYANDATTASSLSLLIILFYLIFIIFLTN